jgi:hypothetical protein
VPSPRWGSPPDEMEVAVRTDSYSVATILFVAVVVNRALNTTLSV